MEKRSEILCILCKNLRRLLDKTELIYDRLNELRLRVHGPFIAVYDGHEYFIGEQGGLVSGREQAYRLSEADIRDTLELISNYSLYAYEDEIRQGFITVEGGHRIGLAGTVVAEQGRIRNVKNIYFINIRVSHQITGCALPVLPYIRDADRVYHTLIISPPRGGKTTLLRDMIRCISDGDGKNAGMTVGVVDERSELGACYRGMPQNDLGMRTDILDCCPKVDGMLMLIRSMAPQVIAVDEIGSIEDIEAIAYVIHCGCRIFATVHGMSIDDIKNKPVLRKLVEERIFERYIVLGNSRHAGRVDSIFDAMGNRLYDSGVRREAYGVCG